MKLTAWVRKRALDSHLRSLRKAQIETLNAAFFGLDVVKFARSSQIHLDLKVTP